MLHACVGKPGTSFFHDFISFFATADNFPSWNFFRSWLTESPTRDFWTEAGKHIHVHIRTCVQASTSKLTRAAILNCWWASMLLVDGWLLGEIRYMYVHQRRHGTHTPTPTHHTPHTTHTHTHTPHTPTHTHKGGELHKVIRMSLFRMASVCLVEFTCYSYMASGRIFSMHWD